MCKTTIRNNSEVQIFDIHYHSPTMEKFIQKEVKIIVPITRNEMKYLTKEHKVPFGENGIIAVGRTYRKWILTENKHNMSLLENYRKSRIVEK